MDPNDERTWSPVVKLLALWRLFGRSGLTLHALATLTKQSPLEILNELEGNPWVYAAHCGDVKALVWEAMVNSARNLVGEVYYLFLNPGPMNRTLYRQIALSELAKWPYPQYTSIHRGEGKTEGVVHDNKVLAVIMERMARGKYVNLQTAIDAYRTEAPKLIGVA